MTVVSALTLDRVLTGLPELTVEEVAIVRPAFNGRTGQLKFSKPFGRIEPTDSTEEAVCKGCANYVWRMLAFDFSGYGKNACMPVTADWDISAALYRRDEDAGCKESNRDARWNECKGIRDRMDSLIKLVESVVPLTAQAGVMRWGRALGYAI